MKDEMKSVADQFEEAAENWLNLATGEKNKKMTFISLLILLCGLAPNKELQKDLGDLISKHVMKD